MSNPVIEAFFLGRAVAEVLGEKVEQAFTDMLSDLGKFDAEQKEKLREFTEEVKARAKQDVQQANRLDSTADTGKLVKTEPTDLQEIIDELRAEIARLRAELNDYRSQKTDSNSK